MDKKEEENMILRFTMDGSMDGSMDGGISFFHLPVPDPTTCGSPIQSYTCMLMKNSYNRYDDLLPEESETVQKAIKRLPPKEAYDRVFRIRRAFQVRGKKKKEEPFRGEFWYIYMDNSNLFSFSM